MRPPAARDIRGGSPCQHGCPILAPACPGGATDDGAIAQGAARHVGLCAHLLGNVPRAGRRHTVPRQVQAGEVRDAARQARQRIALGLPGGAPEPELPGRPMARDRRDGGLSRRRPAPRARLGGAPRQRAAPGGQLPVVGRRRRRRRWMRVRAAGRRARRGAERVAPRPPRGAAAPPPSPAARGRSSRTASGTCLACAMTRTRAQSAENARSASAVTPAATSTTTTSTSTSGAATSSPSTTRRTRAAANPCRTTSSRGRDRRAPRLAPPADPRRGRPQPRRRRAPPRYAGRADWDNSRWRRGRGGRIGRGGSSTARARSCRRSSCSIRASSTTSASTTLRPTRGTRLHGVGDWTAFPRLLPAVFPWRATRKQRRLLAVWPECGKRAHDCEAGAPGADVHVSCRRAGGRELSGKAMALETCSSVIVAARTRLTVQSARAVSFLPKILPEDTTAAPMPPLTRVHEIMRGRHNDLTQYSLELSLVVPKPRARSAFHRY